MDRETANLDDIIDEAPMHFFLTHNKLRVLVNQGLLTTFNHDAVSDIEIGT